METLTARETIDKTFEIVKDTSYTEKRFSIPTQADTDNFLDTILSLQDKLNSRSEKIDFINAKLEELTWLDHIDEGSLKQINNVIGIAKDLHSILLIQYIKLNNLRNKGIAKDATKRFKYVIDNLKEIIIDLDSIFFSLPAIPGFKETTKELSLI